MSLDRIAARGMVLLGCGKMGSALLAGWLSRGMSPGSVHVIDPAPSDWLRAQGVAVNAPLPESPAVALLAVKPQMMGKALPAMTGFAGGPTLFVSIAAGTSIAHFEESFGTDSPIIRAMPNTPAAVGRGITALIGNARATDADMALAEALMAAVGATLRLDEESQMDAVTGLSGSGPAYVFHMIEAMAAAGEAEGLSPEMALTLARATVTGAGELAYQAPESPAQLRKNVTSPGGTTAAALAVLMDPDAGLPALMRRAVAAAAARSRELGQ